MKDDQKITKEELCQIMGDLRTISERDYCTNFSANDGKDLRDIVRAEMGIKLHVCRLVEEILNRRDNPPDPPEDQTVGGLLSLFKAWGKDG